MRAFTRSIGLLTAQPVVCEGASAYKQWTTPLYVLLVATVVLCVNSLRTSGAEQPVGAHEGPPTQPWIKTPPTVAGGFPPRCKPWARDGYQSIQVNVNARSCNILGDAANEPSIAVDPTDPRNIVIGWRQFDTVESDFRQAGYAYSHDGGHTWVFPGSLTPGEFGTDPVLAADAPGTIFYLSINFDQMRLFRSANGGATWYPPIRVPGFWDKPWMVTDQTDGPGRGHIYISAQAVFFRSTDGGATFNDYPEVPYWATLSVGPEGEVYAYYLGIKKSVDARDSAASPTFTEGTYVPLCPNPSSTVVGQGYPRGCSETRIFGQNQSRSLKT